MGGYFPWVKDYTWPQSIEEAVSIIEEAKERAAVVAGGTSVAMRIPKRVETLVDLHGLGLDQVAWTGDLLNIGAMVSLRSLETQAPDLWNGVIARACSTVGSRLVRNAATIGGEMAVGLPWCDIPVLMAALDARVIVAKKGKTEAIPTGRWATEKPSAILENRVITALEIPARKQGQGLGFYKVTRIHGEYGAATTAAWVEIDRGTITGARVIAGAVSPHPQALDYVENAMIGKDSANIDLDAITEPIEKRFKAAGDPRFSKEYRQKMTRVAAKRAIAQAIAMAKEDR